MDVCSRCGAEVAAPGRFCSGCGAALDPASAPMDEIATEERARPAGTPVTPPLMRGRFAAGAVLERRFAIVDLLGHGGMGEVYRAEDLSLRQTVALKFLPREVSRDPASMQRIREEVRLARRVSHPNVCRVHDLGEADGQPFISMEYIDGENLASLLKRIGRLPAEKALEIARQVCGGLAAAHAAGVLHRDLKPANVMLDEEGRAHITDFGIAVPGGTAEAGELAGTPAYMAPEQLAGLGASVKSDLYSLGLVLYELVTGRRLFSGGSLSELSRQQRALEPGPPSLLASDIPPEVERVILQCLARDPNRRPPSALSILTALSGGDPLGAALAAGQTPSPQAVAALPASGALRPAVAWACAAAALASLGLYGALGGEFSAEERAGLRLPPAALAEKAREAVRELGLAGPWTGEAFAYAYDADAVRFVGAASSEVARSEAFALAEERLIVFWYRCSPDFLVPLDRGAAVSREDPPPGAGEVRVELDSAGRLLSAVTVPTPTTDGASGEVDATALLRLAGFDPTRLEATAPRGSRAASEDVRQAWRGHLAGRPGVEMTVEAAFHAGRPVFFRVLAPWTTVASAGGKPRAFFVAGDLVNAFVLTMLLAAIPLARHNLRLGRGDRRGALRLATLVFLGFVVRRTLTLAHVPIFDAERAMLMTAVVWGLYFGGSTWLLYVALEPFARRVWPERLVSWTRLLAGQARDPMVARDILIGTTFAWGLAAANSVLPRWLPAGPLVFVEHDLEPLLGNSGRLAATVLAFFSAVRFGLLCLLLLLLLRLGGRFRRLAHAGLGVVLLAIFYTAVWSTPGTASFTALALSVLSGVVLVLLLARYGLLAAVTALFWMYLWLFSPQTTRLTGWYASCTWWGLGVTLLLVGYGLYFSTGGRPLGVGNLMEE